jgi:cell division protease FtsH
MNNDESNKKPNDKKKVNIARIITIFLLAAVVTYLGVTFFKSCYNKYTTSEISYSTFIEMIDNNEIKSVKYTSN